MVFTASSSVHPIRSVGSASGWLDVSIDGTEFAASGDFGGRVEIPLDGLSSGNPIVTAGVDLPLLANPCAEASQRIPQGAARRVR